MNLITIQSMGTHKNAVNVAKMINYFLRLPNVLRHNRPRSICIIGGVFLFLLVVVMDVLIALVQFAGCLILIALCLGLFIMTLIMFCVITGSSVDPDDNGLLKTKAQKEAWRKEKLEKHKIDL